MSHKNTGSSNNKAHKVAKSGESSGALGTVVGGAVAGVASVALMPFVPPQVHLMAIGLGAKVGNGIEKAVRDTVFQQK